MHRASGHRAPHLNRLAQTLRHTLRSNTPECGSPARKPCLSSLQACLQRAPVAHAPFQRAPVAHAPDRSLGIYLKALSDRPDEVSEVSMSQSLMRIGQLAKATGESNATLRYWTQEGLLEVADTTEAGYQLYTHERTS